MCRNISNLARILTKFLAMPRGPQTQMCMRRNRWNNHPVLMFKRHQLPRSIFLNVVRPQYCLYFSTHDFDRSAAAEFERLLAIEAHQSSGQILPEFKPMACYQTAYIRNVGRNS
jgi:hypothetical protein